MGINNDLVFHLPSLTTDFQNYGYASCVRIRQNQNCEALCAYRGVCRWGNQRRSSIITRGYCATFLLAMRVGRRPGILAWSVRQCAYYVLHAFSGQAPPSTTCYIGNQQVLNMRILAHTHDRRMTYKALATPLLHACKRHWHTPRA